MSDDQATQTPQGITFVDDAEVAASFKADIEKRTITGMLVPWGRVAKSGFAKWKFGQGSLYWSAARRVKMNVGHERKETVGVGSASRIAQPACSDRSGWQGERRATEPYSWPRKASSTASR